MEVWRVGRWHLGSPWPLRLVGAEFSLSQAECQFEDSHAGSTSLMHVQVCVYEDILGAGRRVDLQSKIGGLGAGRCTSLMEGLLG